MKVGFIGLGSMGQGIARSLLRAGHQVMVYNRTRSKAEELLSDNARVADRPQDAARGAEALITMLSDDRAVEEIVFGDGEKAQEGEASSILSALGRGTTHISMSTISVALSRRLAEAHGAAGQGYIAALVFGRPEAAAAAKLWIVASGPPEQIERFRPLFDAMGRGVSVIGDDVAAANVVKVAGNFMIASMIEALGEAFALSRKSGIEASQFLDVINGALFNSPVYENYGRIIAEERYEPAGFKLRLGLKDVRLVLEAADEAAAPMPLASLIHNHFLSAVARGRGEIDWAALAGVSAENAGLNTAEQKQPSGRK